ncbi:aryl hydrocarbon receptor repressor isoform X2 [Engystomops pustulosus]|uniref:aryl hydrocarbon receptor repressor isoform X2 n=1 Tax=Engystomops pustulosus TaxID=76066 RepID=UPI003AFB54B5
MHRQMHSLILKLLGPAPSSEPRLVMETIGSPPKPAIEEQHSKKQPCQPVGHAIKGDNPSGGIAMPEGELLLESLSGFALVVSTEGMIFYASSTILDYLGFHQTDVMHQNVYDYIHVDDRQEFCRQLHWAMNPQQMIIAQEAQTETGEEIFLKKLYKAQETNSSSSEYSAFLNRCFICRVRCLLDSTSGFLTMQFEGKLKFLFGQKKKTSPGTSVLPQMALFCLAVPLLLPPFSEMKMKSVVVRTQKKPGAPSNNENAGRAFSSNDAENCGRNGQQGVCFTNMLPNTENQTKLMNAGDSGISLLKVRTNEDQWVWVEASPPILYRNGCSDYVVIPQQAQRDDEAQTKKQTMLGMKGSRDVPLNNILGESPALLKPPHTWEKHEKEDIKMKFNTTKTDSFLHEENYLPRPFSSMQNHCNTSSGWTLKNPIGSRSGHQLIGSSRSGRPFYNMDQGHAGVHLTGHPHRGGVENFQAYHGLQQHSVQPYPSDAIKMENAFVTPDILYDSGLPMNIPIKIENDSDSEGRSEPYTKQHSHGWASESNVLKRTLMDSPEGLHLKTESRLNGPHLCLKPKHHMHSTHRGHCFVPPAHMNHINTSRPYKGLYNKDPTQFYPQKCNYLDSILSQQGADCLSSALYASDDKNLGDQSYKMQCEAKTHNIVQNIKREPLDSPPWIESEQDPVPALYQKNQLMGFLPGQMPHNATEFAYI